MRKWFPALALLGVVAAGWLLWRQFAAPPAGPTHDQAVQSTTTLTGSSADANPPKVISPGHPALGAAAASSSSVSLPEAGSVTASAAPPVASGNPHEPEFTQFPPEIVLQKVSHAIRDYASMFGGNPVGTNPEITAALNGNNPRQANFINPEAGMRINGNGELMDAWGTPYFFHQISGHEMEIHSAGPDRIMWSSDDLVAR